MKTVVYTQYLLLVGMAIIAWRWHAQFHVIAGCALLVGATALTVAAYRLSKNHSGFPEAITAAIWLVTLSLGMVLAGR